jgi:adrenodoxin-NADP+ reductase
VGTTIPLSSLLPHYDAILFSYGASKDRELGIPGEHLQGVYSARSFVAWYNGLPASENLKPSIWARQGKGRHSAVVIGQGNVALDVARILLADIDRLRRTDIPEPVLDTLSRNTVKDVYIVGRRGPSQVSRTSPTPILLRLYSRIDDHTPRLPSPSRNYANSEQNKVVP